MAFIDKLVYSKYVYARKVLVEMNISQQFPG